MDGIDHSDEIQLIFSYLQFNDIRHIIYVSKRWKELMLNPIVLHKISLEEQTHVEKKMLPKDTYTRYFQHPCSPDVIYHKKRVMKLSHKVREIAIEKAIEDDKPEYLSVITLDKKFYDYFCDKSQADGLYKLINQGSFKVLNYILNQSSEGQKTIFRDCILWCIMPGEKKTPFQVIKHIGGEGYRIIESFMKRDILKSFLNTTSNNQWSCCVDSTNMLKSHFNECIKDPNFVYKYLFSTGNLATYGSIPELYNLGLDFTVTNELGISWLHIVPTLGPMDTHYNKWPNLQPTKLPHFSTLGSCFLVGDNFLWIPNELKTIIMETKEERESLRFNYFILGTMAICPIPTAYPYYYFSKFLSTVEILIAFFKENENILPNIYQPINMISVDYLWWKNNLKLTSKCFSFFGIMLYNIPTVTDHTILSLNLLLSNSLKPSEDELFILKQLEIEDCIIPPPNSEPFDPTKISYTHSGGKRENEFLIHLFPHRKYVGYRNIDTYLYSIPRELCTIMEDYRKKFVDYVNNNCFNK